MYICYLDESGVPEQGAGSSHFVLAGIAISVDQWKAYDTQLTTLKGAHKLGNAEVHTAWMTRYYPEQERISDFSELSIDQRRMRVTQERKVDLGKTALRGSPAVRKAAKNYKKTDAYIHLSHLERLAVVNDVADLVGSWNDATIFAEIQKKDVTKPTARYPDPAQAIGDNAFEQVVARFHAFLKRKRSHGIIVYDQNQAMSTRLTKRMRRFHATGTFHSAIPRIVDTPFFVDSTLTSMVQVADLVAFGTRRYIEKGEEALFSRFQNRFDRLNERIVGARHYIGKESCPCRICAGRHR